MTKYCPSCCLDCQQATSSGTSFPAVPNTPFALGNLLQAGTVTLNISPEIRQAICDHHHAEDDWHEFKPTTLIPMLADSQYMDFCGELEFLTRQRFVAVTYRCSENGQLILRVYLIPYDLVNVQGRLRIRKDNILNPARRYMRNLLPKIIQDLDTWDGLPLARNAKELVSEVLDPRTLSEIYSDLRSPIVSPTGCLGNITARLLNSQDNLEGLGMRSTLYTYQRRSVAAMLQRELDPRDVPDPLYISAGTIDGRDFYLQPGTMEILQQRPMTAPCKGGILCEELGTGKTIMMLSLIVATKDQIPLPEPSIIDERPIMTPLAFRHFPSGDFASTRKRFHRRLDPLEKRNSGSRIPTLVELLIHQYRVSPHCGIPRNISSRNYTRMVEMKDRIETLPLGDILRANAPFYLHYSGVPQDWDRVKRKKSELSPRLMYLTSATLVIVPPNLLSQWDREIMKHCAVPLRVLILRSKTMLPCVRNLANDYDIILMTYTRFTAESSLQDFTKLQTWNSCACPEFPGYRVPHCSCQVPGITPLLQVRWKRLVIDEGHVSANLSTTFVPFAKTLSVERRWIISGTPTTNLLGLGLGSKGIEPSTNLFVKTNDTLSCHGLPEEDPIGMDEATSSSLEASPTGTPSPTTPPKRIWTRYDREDLNKLGNMITHFIAVPQFNADCTLISTHVTEALLDPCGPRRGSIQVLNQLMEMVMIRHRIEDVEKAVILPPVSHESVLLDLDPYVVKSFNALQAAIVVNAVDSQRTDQDYLFHARNTEHLQVTVRNMSQLLFWHVDSGLFNADELVKTSAAHIQRAIDRNVPEEDIELLKEAFHHLDVAAEDQTWRAIQSHEDVPYRVFNMVQSVFDVWTRIPGNEAHAPVNQTGFLHADRLLKLYDMVIQRPLIRENAMIEWGCAVAKRDEAFRKAYDESLHRKNRGRKKGKAHNEDYAPGSMMADNFSRKASAANTLKEMQKELDATLTRLSTEEDMDDEWFANRPEIMVPAPPSPSRHVSTLVASSPLAKMRIGSSASTKLNYIINEVDKYASTEKFLIFSGSPLTLAHVAEALALIHVKFLRFTTQITSQFREQLVLTFETSETYRVFLMELKHGARGLNLISASRVIFCEPVWQADVESQAIKRAHRIGQTREIIVKTLAIRHSAEEKMVSRRAALKDSHEKLPRLIEEVGMRHYIANPKFLTQIPSLIPTVDFSFLDLPDPPVSHSEPVILKIPPLSSPLKRVRVEDPVLEQSKVEPSPKKKKTSIRFLIP